MKNSVFIATSIDGLIADTNGGIEWLNTVPNPENIDMGYHNFMEQIDAIIMGRNTYEKVLSFGIDWPYPKPVFVLSTTLNKVPENFNGDVRFVNGELSEVLDSIHSKGFKNLYIDGGATIQSFLKEDLIEELILTTIPIVLGNGIPLFKDLPKHITFELTQSIIFLDTVVQNHFKRKIF